MDIYDVVILGGGISGYMMARRLSTQQPELTIAMIDKGMDNTIHPFHLHKLILEIPELAKIKPHLLHTNIWDGEGLKKEPTLLDINQYSWKIFGTLQILNIAQQGTLMIYPVTKEELKNAFVSSFVLFKCSAEKIDLIQKRIICNGYAIGYNNIVSTIPLPVLLKMMEVEVKFEFKNYPFYSTQYNNVAENLYQMIYNISDKCNITRTTLLGDVLYVESKTENYTEEDKNFLTKLYNITSFEKMSIVSPGRIKPLPSRDRKPLLHWLTEKNDIMVLGRYGAWTFKVANDVWEDTKFISDIIYAKQQACNFINGGRK